MPRRARIWRGRRCQWLVLALATMAGSGCLGQLQPAAQRELALRLASRHDLRVDPPRNELGPEVPAHDPRLAFIGRSDEGPGPDGSLPTTRALVWPGSEVRLQFSGSAISVTLRSVGEVHLDLEVDGRPYLLSARSDGEHRYALLALPPGRHLLRLIKRTEAAAGVAELVAVQPDADGSILAAPTLPSRHLEFLGDSMTVGACAYDHGAERWDRRETHDHRASFAARTAQRLAAQHQAIAVSGLGVSQSLVGLRAEQIFDRQRPDSQSRLATAYPAPDAVVVLLGHNDVLAARRAGQPFPAQFTDDYVRLIRAIRQRYPTSLIVCTSGGMFHSQHSCRLRRAWAAAVQQLRQTDARIVAHRFQSWSYLHPRAQTHAQLADELTPLLARHLGWAAASEPTASPR